MMFYVRKLGPEINSTPKEESFSSMLQCFSAFEISFTLNISRSVISTL